MESRKIKTEKKIEPDLEAEFEITELKGPLKMPALSSQIWLKPKKKKNKTSV